MPTADLLTFTTSKPLLLKAIRFKSVLHEVAFITKDH